MTNAQKDDPNLVKLKVIHFVTYERVKITSDIFNQKLAKSISRGSNSTLLIRDLCHNCLPLLNSVHSAIASI